MDEADQVAFATNTPADSATNDAAQSSHYNADEVEGGEYFPPQPARTPEPVRPEPRWEIS